MKSRIAVSWGMWVGTAALIGTLAGAAGRPSGIEAPGRHFSHDAVVSSRSDSFKVRLAAVKLLARRIDADGEAHLRALAEDPHPLVREVAARALAARAAEVSLCTAVADNGAR